MENRDRFISVMSLILGIVSIVLCFTLGYAGPAAGALCAATALFVLRQVERADSMTKAARAAAFVGLIINAVSCLAMLLMALLGAAYLESAASLF